MLKNEFEPFLSHQYLAAESVLISGGDTRLMVIELVTLLLIVATTLYQARRGSRQGRRFAFLINL